MCDHLFFRLVELAGSPQGSVFTPDGNMPLQKAVSAIISKLSESTYSTYVGQLKCGNLSAKIGLYPSPHPHTIVSFNY